ncbi:hypothetical protein PWT90_02892 [Aphanocladium album]|nr:hypothetical protein PWT90_02892 [Aphanocladium album]
MATVSFTLFPHLPVEIRLQIWNLALATEAPGRVLYNYKSGCWGARQMTEAELHYSPIPEENSTLEFDHQLLGEAEFAVPLFQVNREARSVTRTYTRCRNLVRRDSVSCIFIRRYDPSRDVLFIPDASALYDFIADPTNRLFEPDIDGHIVDCPVPPITRLAITPASLALLSDVLEEVWHHWGRLETIYVVVDSPEDTRQNEGEHWEILSAHDTAYVLDPGARRLVWVGERWVGGRLGELFAEIDSCAVGWAEKILGNHHDRFEMRVVYMVRR